MSNQEPSTTHPGSAVVLGGGVAGIAAAVRLARAGVRVTLVEMRSRLGGRATSWEDPVTGRLLDNCQHVVLRCCSAILELYEMLGVADRVSWHRRFTFVHHDGTTATLDRGPWPAPLHLAGAFLRFRGLSWGDKWAIGRALLVTRGMSDERLRALNGESFADWLDGKSQPVRAVERFWEPAVVSACNETLERVAAGYALQVFRDGLLGGRRAYEMGLSEVPLAELYDPAEAAIAAAGGELLTRSAVKEVEFDEAVGRVTAARLGDGTRLEADAFVSALPFDALDRVVMPAMRERDARLRRLGELEVSPIVGLHLWVRSGDGGATMRLPHVVLTGSPIHWFFDRGTDGEGVQHLHGVVSAAHELAATGNDAVLALAMEELRRVVPGCAGAELVEGKVVKERRATFSCRPGVDALRPPGSPDSSGRGIGNLWLAGDWCETGWPATMEGAARSGFAAANGVTGESHGH